MYIASKQDRKPVVKAGNPNLYSETREREDHLDREKREFCRWAAILIDSGHFDVESETRMQGPHHEPQEVWARAERLWASKPEDL